MRGGDCVQVLLWCPGGKEGKVAAVGAGVGGRELVEPVEEVTRVIRPLLCPPVASVFVLGPVMIY